MLRPVLVAVVAVHLVYPVGFLAVTLGLGSGGSAYAAGAELALLFVVVVIAGVVGPLVWRAWQGGRLAPWMFAAFVALESWLYWNGSRTPSWRAEPSSGDRLAFAMFVAHALATAALLTASVASSLADHRRT